MSWLMLLVAIPAWFVQYVIYVPVVLLLRVFRTLVRFALTIGLVGIVLLFVPIIGWIILLLWLLMRRDDRRYRELLEAIARKEGYDSRRRSIWRPSLIDRVRGAAR